MEDVVDMASGAGGGCEGLRGMVSDLLSLPTMDGFRTTSMDEVEDVVLLAALLLIGEEGGN